MIGISAAHLFVAIDQEDMNFILRRWDEAPNGKRQLLTTGFLKASHREPDEPVTRPVTHKIYRDALHTSRLVLPSTSR